MIVPEFWAEAKERILINGKARTYKRFGWSDVSETAALENAQERVLEAVAQARAGEQVRAVDHKVSYNGAEGLPIREEIIERHDDVIITRNSYGALCLNTPDVLFADVDTVAHTYNVGRWLYGTVLVAFVASQWNGFDPLGVLGLVVVLGVLLAANVAKKIESFLRQFKGDPFDAALESIEAFSTAHPDWLMRVYRTPNGYRVLVLQELFDPSEEAAFEFMSAIGTDQLYMRMCRNQRCFRARLTPKPWRIDMRHIMPRPGVWPISDARMPDRRSWVAQYTDESSGYASCRFEKEFGRGRPMRKCEDVQVLHDDLCKATQSLPLA